VLTAWCWGRLPSISAARDTITATAGLCTVALRFVVLTTTRVEITSRRRRGLGSL
jgi:hypothetical protein